MRTFLLLVLCVGVSQGFIDALWKRCYGEYGCFYASSPFDNARGWLPESPESMEIEFLLFTRTNPNTAQILDEDDSASIQNSNYNPSNPTKFIIHGYTDSGRSDWVVRMTRELLKAEDANVVAVHWNKGATKVIYFQAAANTRVVGAVTAKLVRSMNTAGASFSDFHLIGHSLGAHTCGYVGEIIQGIGRITGLDPAGPAFENYKPPARLDSSDANFVVSIHTDGENLGNFGFGMLKASGHANFYPNGGFDQPGCPENHGDHIFSLFTSGEVACSHGRAHEFFTSSINKCEYKAYPCTASDYEVGQCKDCGSGCSNMGYHASPSEHGSFYLTTSDVAPDYC